MRISYEIHASYFSLCIHRFPFHIVQHRRPLRYGDQGDLRDRARGAGGGRDRRYPHGVHSTEHHVPL